LTVEGRQLEASATGLMFSLRVQAIFVVVLALFNILVAGGFEWLRPQHLAKLRP
jgi:hypothetical protein